MGSDGGSLDAGIEGFAAGFLARLETFSIAYDSSYNAPCRRAEGRLSAVEGKPVVSVVEVTLRQLYGEAPASSTVKLSKTEPSLIKLFREAAAMLGCAVKNVILVQDGQVLREDSRVARVIACASSPLYVFNRAALDDNFDAAEGTVRVSAPLAGIGATGFRDELVKLLQRHFDPPQAAILASRFIQEYPGWLAADSGNGLPSL